MLRLLIILLLVVAGTPRAWTLPDATAPAGMSFAVACCSMEDSAAEAACCDRRSCGLCAATGCSCGVRRLEKSDPVPVAPVPTGPRDLVVLARIDAVASVPTHATPAPPRTARRGRTVCAGCSSHEFRAILGIWLT